MRFHRDCFVATATASRNDVFYDVYFVEIKFARMEYVAEEIKKAKEREFVGGGEKRD